VTVLDASCLVALLRGESGQSDVVAALTTECQMSVLNRAEVIDRMSRQGARPDDVAADLDILSIEFVPLTIDLADAAAQLRSRYYHRTERPLSMADCVALATAVDVDEALATSDAHLATIAAEIGCRVVAVANSNGIKPIG
jgi:PIN domain nuclease of toxin-antitoxin system